MSIRFELFSNDPQKSVNFYTKILGFELTYSDKTYFSLKRDTVLIGIGYPSDLHAHHHFRPEIMSGRKGLGIEIVFEVENIEEEYVRIQKSDYPIAEALQKREWGLTDFRLVDPDGYYIRITSRD